MSIYVEKTERVEEKPIEDQAYGREKAYRELENHVLAYLKKGRKQLGWGIISGVLSFLTIPVIAIIGLMEPASSIHVIHHLLQNASPEKYKLASNPLAKLWGILSGFGKSRFSELTGACIILIGVAFSVVTQNRRVLITIFGLVLAVGFAPMVMRSLDTLYNPGNQLSKSRTDGVKYAPALISANHIVLSVNRKLSNDNQYKKILTREEKSRLKNDVAWLINHPEKEWYRGKPYAAVTEKAKYITRLEHTAGMIYSPVAQEYRKHVRLEIDHLQEIMREVLSVALGMGLASGLLIGSSLYKKRKVRLLQSEMGDRVRYLDLERS